MDFLKTLMLYMTMTFATAVQGAPTPEITPEPTPTPAVVVVETLLPDQTPSPTPAPGTTAAPTAQAEATIPPTATMTPNPGYKNLEKGDRGTKVKTLQERLIELGYLTGEADGAYGNQTRRAVMRFQYYNGLTQDGVAGKATQTHLFEDPNVVANPDAATATPVATDTPAPTAETTIAAPEEPTDTPAPTDEPTVVPPAAQADAATDAPATDAPAETASAPAATTATGLTVLADAAVVLNDGGAPLTCLRQQDGVMVGSKPRVYQREDGMLYLSLEDLCAAVEDWTLTQAEDTWTLQAMGYEVVISAPAAGNAAVTVDGAAVALTAEDVLRDGSELQLSEDFFRETMSAEVIWDAEEAALMLRIPDKAAAQAAD